MKKVIKNLLYDTSTAKPLATVEKETLYRKKNGEYFLYIDYENWQIVPMSFDEAEVWKRRNNYTEPKGQVVIRTIKFDSDVLYKLERNADSEGLSLNDYINKHLRSTL